MRIRQSRVLKHYVHSAFSQMKQGFAHPQQVRQFETSRLFRAEHLAQQSGISRVILNQNNMEPLILQVCATSGALSSRRLNLAKKRCARVPMHQPSEKKSFS